MTFTKKQLKALRLNLGLSRKQMSEVMGMTETSYYGFEVRRANDLDLLDVIPYSRIENLRMYIESEATDSMYDYSKLPFIASNSKASYE